MSHRLITEWKMLAHIEGVVAICAGVIIGATLGGLWTLNQRRQWKKEDGKKEKKRNKQYDIYLCHAKADRDTVARPLYWFLRQRAIVNVFYDEKLPHHRNASVATLEALDSCHAAVIVLSSKFFNASDDWPIFEAKTLIQNSGLRNGLVLLWKGSIEERQRTVAQGFAIAQAAQLWPEESPDALGLLLRRIVRLCHPNDNTPPLVLAQEFEDCRRQQYQL